MSRWAGAALLLVCWAGSAMASEVAPVDPDAVETPVPASFLPLPEPVAQALARSDWAAAATGLIGWPADELTGPQRADRAFLVAWSLVRSDRAVEATTWLSAFDGVTRAPAPLVDLTAGEILAASGSREDALRRLEAVPSSHPAGPRALAAKAEVLRALDRTQEASVAWSQVVDRADPGAGIALGLRVIAERLGPGSEAALAPLRRLWRAYPTTDEGRWATAVLRERYPDRRSDWRERAARAEALMGVGAWKDAADATDGLDAEVVRGTVDGCGLAYTRARSMYKLNRLSDMLAFLDAGGLAWCAGITGEDGHGHKLRYLQGMATTRLKRHAEAAAAYAAIAVEHPETTYADDGLTRAGIAWLEAGDTEAALAAWREALERFPSGDTVPEATFRLAFTRWEQGAVDEALRTADALAALPASQDEVHVLAGRYWAARWRAWPAMAGDTPASGPARQEAVDRFTELARQAPHHWYGALAFARLAQLAPRTAAGLQRAHRSVPDPSRLPVRTGWREDPAVAEGVAMLQLGLVRDGLARLAEGPQPTAAEVAWTAALQASVDAVGAHTRMHDLLHGVSAIDVGPARDRILAVALPDLYGDAIRAAVQDRGLEARMFHAIVREESRFDPAIRSWAGARGLSQLMPATAADVARRTGLPARDLTDPDQNLPLGAAYLGSLLARLSVPQLAMAAYNAGPGNAGRWLEERGGVPLDVFVERIPFRETRGYVKRVTSTWQAYRWIHDVDAPPYLDLSTYLDAVPGG